MFASVAGLAVLSRKLATLIGSIPLLLLLVCVWIVGMRLLVARSEDTWSRDAAIAALLAYCAVFCFNTAYGRLCPGLAYAGVSRYTPDVVLGFFGLYLLIPRQDNGRAAGDAVSLRICARSEAVLSDP
jgi:hypothetical protein